jgi:CheY-like chemotaxis protein
MGSACDVLVVDRHTDTRQDMVDLLAKEGLSVIGAPGTAEVLTLLRTGLSPGLILLDLARMDARDAVTVLDGFRSHPAVGRLPIVVTVTCETDLMAPVFAVLRKPLDPSKLLRLVWPVVRRKPYQRPPTPELRARAR